MFNDASKNPKTLLGNSGRSMSTNVKEAKKRLSKSLMDGPSLQKTLTRRLTRREVALRDKDFLGFTRTRE